MLATKPLRRALVACIVTAAAMIGGTACTATVTARPARTRVLYDYPVVYVDEAPARVYDSPRVNYRGRPAYLVGTRWYYSTDNGWLYFAEEPRELQHQRTERRYLQAESRRPRRQLDSPRVERRERERYVEPPRETRRRRHDSN
jgi:hypothetical protein